MQSKPELAGTRFLRINLQPDVKGSNVLGYLLACWAGIMVASFVPTLQPYLLTEFLHVPEAKQGVVSGKLAFLGEVVFILTAGFWGAISDKFGRRIVIASAFLIFSVGIWCYPRVDSLMQLYMARSLIGFGFAAYSCMAITLIADYAQPDSRGKLTGYHGIANGFGALTAVFFLLRLPAMLQARGMSPVEAGYITYNIVAVMMLVIALLTWLGTKDNKQDSSEEKASLVSIFRGGLLAAKHPVIRLSYAAAFVARGNLTIVGTFFTLWLANYGTDIGLDRAEGIKRAGMVVGIAQMVTLFGAVAFGIMADKFDHIKVLMLTLFIAAIGYGSTYFIVNPFGGWMIVCAVFIGLGEVGCIITSAVLIADHSPVKVRGAVIGFFNICGGLGILVASAVGGYLFDYWDPTGPFVLFALAAIVVFFWGGILLRRQKNSSLAV
ncbi:MAG: MFS transporter [Pseudomonadales bacterium]